MNCTSHINTATEVASAPEALPFKTRCNRLGIDVPGFALAPSQIIPYVEARLAAHMKHVGRTMNPWTGDYAEWKLRHDAFHELLTDLRAAQSPQIITPTPPIAPIPTSVPMSRELNKNSTAEPGKNPQTPSPQQTQSRNEPGMNPEKPGTKSEQPGIAQNQTGKFPVQVGNSEQPAQPTSPPSSTCPPPKTAPSEAPDDPDSPPNFESDDEQFIDAATDLHYKRKGRSPFDKLSPQDQAFVIDLFDKHHWQAVLKAIAQPAPNGFGLKVSKTALYDFHKRYNKRRRQENVQASIDLVTKSSDPAQAFAQIFERLVQIKALTIASDREASLTIFEALINTTNKLRKQSLAERKQFQAEKSK